MKGFDFKRYLIRIVKYMIYLAIVFILIVAIYSLASGQEMRYRSLFRPGTEFQMIIFFVLISIVYPLLGFGKKSVYLNKSFAEDREKIKEVFETCRYIVTEETATTITFRLSSNFVRALRMFEDSIILDYSDNPIILDGQKRDVTRIVRAIEYATRREEQ